MENFYKGLPGAAAQRLREYGFDSHFGKEIVEGAAAALLDNPAEISRLMEGLPPIFQQALKTKLKVLVQAGEVLSATSSSVSEVSTGIEAQVSKSIDALRKLMDGEVTLDIIALVNQLPFVVAIKDGSKPDPELTMDALRATAMKTSRVSPGSQYKGRMVFAPKQFIPVPANPFTGQALDEGAMYVDLLEKLSDPQKMFISFMREKGYLSKLGRDLNSRVDAIYSALIEGRYSSVISQAKVEWGVAKNDRATMALLKKGLFVEAPGLRGESSGRVEVLLVSQNFVQRAEKLMISFFSSGEMRRFVRYLPDGERLVACLPGREVSQANFSEAVVGLLISHGLFEGDCVWEYLIEERPRRKAEVNDLRGLYSL